MRNKKLIIQQLDQKLSLFVPLISLSKPSIGWIKSIRTALNMTLEQMGNRLSMTKQGARAIEIREMNGSLTLKHLEEVGKALNLKLVYGFVPMEGSLEKMIEKKSKEKATYIVNKTHLNMVMEDQGNNEEYLKASVEELSDDLKRNMNHIIWD
jgi:predicted DNA-binding mobile mystery protein A